MRIRDPSLRLRSKGDMKIWERIKEKLKRYALLNTFIENYGVRTIVFMTIGIVANIVFAVFNGVTAILYRSIWYGSIAGYYCVLIAQRSLILIVYYVVRKKSGGDAERLAREKQKIYLANGVIVVPLTIALGVAAAQMVLSDNPSVPGEIMAIACATHAFYKVIMAIYNLCKAHFGRDPIVQTIRNLGFVDALVSMLVLATTLIPAFGTMDVKMRTLVAFLALSIVSFSIALGSYMIVHGVKRLTMMKTDREVTNE